MLWCCSLRVCMFGHLDPLASRIIAPIMIPRLQAFHSYGTQARTWLKGLEAWPEDVWK